MRILQVIIIVTHALFVRLNESLCVHQRAVQTEWSDYCRSMNLRSVTIRYFLGSGRGAGDNTVNVQLSMSTPVLQTDYITIISHLHYITITSPPLLTCKETLQKVM